MLGKDAFNKTVLEKHVKGTFYRFMSRLFKKNIRLETPGSIQLAKTLKRNKRLIDRGEHGMGKQRNQKMRAFLFRKSTIVQNFKNEATNRFLI